MGWRACAPLLAAAIVGQAPVAHAESARTGMLVGVVVVRPCLVTTAEPPRGQDPCHAQRVLSARAASERETASSLLDDPATSSPDSPLLDPPTEEKVDSRSARILRIWF